MEVRSGTALMDWLAGTWTVARDINGGGGSFTGRATFLPQDDGTLRWFEQGDLVLGGPALPTTRTLTLDADGQVRFDDGRPFHELVLVDGACDAFHPCGPDDYRGRFEVVDEDTLDVTWQVEGPGRADTIATRYRRVSDPTGG